MSPSSPRCPHFPSPCPPSFFNLGVCASSRHISKPHVAPKLLCAATAQSSLIESLCSGAAQSSLVNPLCSNIEACTHDVRKPHYVQANTNTSKLMDSKLPKLPCGGGSSKTVAAAAAAVLLKLNNGEAAHASYIHKSTFPCVSSLISQSSSMKSSIIHRDCSYPKLSFTKKFNNYDVKPSPRNLGFGDVQGSKYPTRLGIDDSYVDFMPPSSHMHSDIVDFKPCFIKQLPSMHAKPPSLLPPPLKPPSIPPFYSPSIRIVHIKSPKVIETDAASFRSIVQKLTGKSSKKSKKRRTNKREALAPALACSTPPQALSFMATHQGVKASYVPVGADISAKLGAQYKGAKEVDFEGGKRMSSSLQANSEKYLHVPALTSHGREECSESFVRGPAEEPELNAWKSPFCRMESFNEPQESPSSSITSVSANGTSTLSSPTESNVSWEGSCKCSGVKETNFTEWDIIWGLFSAVPSHVLELAQLPPLTLPSSNFEDSTPKGPQTQAIWRFPQLLS